MSRQSKRAAFANLMRHKRLVTAIVRANRDKPGFIGAVTSLVIKTKDETIRMRSGALFIVTKAEPGPTIIPQDDEPAEKFGDDCLCDFTPYADSPEESWHFLRRCASCRSTWYCLHCRCERPTVRCSTCR